MDDEKKNTVCIIGAGPSGLVTAKVLKRDGFNVTIFEKKPTIGGVWAPSRAYAGLCVQNPREHYAFSDFPYPETADEFPTARQVFKYLKSYTKHFRLESHLNLSTEVLSISRRNPDNNGSHSQFDVTVRPVEDPSDVDTHVFDFVIVCTGVFSKPNVPQIEGQEDFNGSLIHSSEMMNRDMLSGKRVVVVGGGKSAHDCAYIAAHEAESSTLLFRSPHWMMPRYFPGDKRVDEIFFTRLSEKILPAYYRASRLERVTRSIAAPLLWLWRRVMSWYVRRVAGIPPEMVPQKPITADAENFGIGAYFYDALQEGLARAKHAEIQSFTENTLRLNSGKEINADLVIFATGWQQDVSILDTELQEIVRPDGNFHLYRFILPPREQRLGFIGYASSGINTLTSEISAHWISEYFLGELNLPDVETMEREIARLHEWVAEVYPKREEGYFIGGHVASYVDELMQDMGLPTRRTDNFSTEFFEPAFAERYKGLGEERRIKRASQKT